MRGMASGLITCFDEVGRGAGGYFVAYLVKYLHGREAAFVAAFTLWGGSALSLSLLTCVSDDVTGRLSLGR